jgi:hypothetical protein
MNHRTPFGAASRVAALVSILALVPLAGPVEGSPGAVPADPIAALAAVQPPQVRTRVLVLGTFHLREIAEEFKPSMLDRLLPVLQGFRPDAICVETLSGTRVRELELRRDAGPLVGQVVDDFAAAHVKLGKRACEVLGTSPEKAAVRVREMFAATRAAGAGKRSPEERAALALWMLAAYDPASAALQWSYLDAQARAAQKAVPADLAALLDARLARVDETYAIAARVARALGLETLEPVDDFEDLDAYAVIDAQLDKDLEGNALVAAISKTPVYQDAASRLKECVKSGDLLPQLALVNSAGYAAADVDAQWGVFLRTHFASGADRGRLGLWENRNLKIAARIRAVAALHPGGRVLVVYGAAHRPFLEAYLARTADVEVVGFENLAPQAPAAGAGAR